VLAGAVATASDPSAGGTCSRSPNDAVALAVGRRAFRAGSPEAGRPDPVRSTVFRRAEEVRAQRVRIASVSSRCRNEQLVESRSGPRTKFVALISHDLRTPLTSDHGLPRAHTRRRANLTDEQRGYLDIVNPQRGNRPASPRERLCCSVARSRPASFDLHPGELEPRRRREASRFAEARAARRRPRHRLHPARGRARSGGRAIGAGCSSSWNNLGLETQIKFITCGRRRFAFFAHSGERRRPPRGQRHGNSDRCHRAGGALRALLSRASTASGPARFPGTVWACTSARAIVESTRRLDRCSQRPG